MLTKFPGDPARAGLPRFHSFNVRGAGVGAKEVPVIASSCGEIVGFPFDDGVAIGLSSGDWTAGDELSEFVPLALPFENFRPPCLVTAATTPPVSFASLLFFLAGIYSQGSR